MGPNAFFHSPLLSFLVIYFVQASPVDSCPSGWMSFEKSCYGLFTQLLLSFEEAEVHCHSLGASGHLASFMNSREMSVVAAYVKDLYRNGKPIWIGLSSYNVKQSIVWKWTDFASISYQNWEPGQPSEAKEAYCAELVPNDYFTWRAAACKEKQPFLCRLM